MTEELSPEEERRLYSVVYGKMMSELQAQDKRKVRDQIRRRATLDAYVQYEGIHDPMCRACDAVDSCQAKRWRPASWLDRLCKSRYAPSCYKRPYLPDL